MCRDVKLKLDWRIFPNQRDGESAWFAIAIHRAVLEMFFASEEIKLRLEGFEPDHVSRLYLGRILTHD